MIELHSTNVMGVDDAAAEVDEGTARQAGAAASKFVAKRTRGYRYTGGGIGIGRIEVPTPDRID